MGQDFFARHFLKQTLVVVNVANINSAQGNIFPWCKVVANKLEPVSSLLEICAKAYSLQSSIFQPSPTRPAGRQVRQNGYLVPFFAKEVLSKCYGPVLNLVFLIFITLCPRSSYSFYTCYLLYKIGNYFLGQTVSSFQDFFFSKNIGILCGVFIYLLCFCDALLF